MLSDCSYEEEEQGDEESEYRSCKREGSQFESKRELGRVEIEERTDTVPGRSDASRGDDQF